MDIKIDEIVQQVISEMTAPAAQSDFVERELPVLTGHERLKTALLKEPEKYTLVEGALPAIGAKEILVKTEGCLVTAADAAEFLKERRTGAVSAQGTDGTGVIVDVGSTGLTDALGNELKAGDRIIAVKRSGVSGKAYGGNPTDDLPADGWYANYAIFPAGKGIYRVNDLDLESRMLFYRAAEICSAADKSIKLGKLDSTSTAAVIGGGAKAMFLTAVLKCKGVGRVVLIGDPVIERKARSFGADVFIDSNDKGGVNGVKERLLSETHCLADAVFNCTDCPTAKKVAKRLVKEKGSVQEMGFAFGSVRKSSAGYEESFPTVNRVYPAREIENCLTFLRAASEKRYPLYQLVTYRYNLDQINEAMWTAVREEGKCIAVCER